MTDLSPRLALPLLHGGQAQKEMTHNEALAILDALTCGSVVDIGQDVPPEAPEPGQCWILGSDPQGDWAGHAGAVAGWTGGGWRFVAPREGMRAWAGQNHGIAVYTSGEWQSGRSFGKVFVEGEQVVGQRAPGVAEPAGGVTVDAEARAAITAVLETLRLHGLIEAP